MEKIRINQSDRLYEIKSIQNVSEHIIKIIFANDIPDDFGNMIHLYTSGDVNYTDIIDFNTVYKNENETVYLSNDGSVYVEPIPEPDIEIPPYTPTPEELLANAKESKKKEMSTLCEQMIYAGTNVTLSDGKVEHFSLTEHDQLNLFGKQTQLASGVTQLEYHADGQPCRYYSAEDMQLIIQAAMWYVSYHTTYCNALNMWIAGCTDINEINTIYYGIEIPEEYRNDVLTTYIVEAENMME